MTRTIANPHGQPPLHDLMLRFLAHGSDVVESGEVRPFEVSAGFLTDPRTAWNDATNGVAEAPKQLPTEWATIVNQPVGAYAVPMAIGNFPQRVRDTHPLLTKFQPSELRPSKSQAPLPGLAGLRGWITKNATKQPLVAAGLARLIGDFDTANELLPADAANEKAALLWQQGECEAALAAWNAMPDSPEVLFNRGMALLFLGRGSEAKPMLTQAVEAIPESSGWHALARLYLAVAEIYG